MSDPPHQNRSSWSWLQFGISLCLIVSGVLTFWLGVNAGFGGKTGMAVIDPLVGTGETCFQVGPLIAAAGVLWLLVLIVRHFRS